LSGFCSSIGLSIGGVRSGMVAQKMSRDLRSAGASLFDFIYGISMMRASVMIFQTAEFPAFGENVDVKIIWWSSLWPSNYERLFHECCFESGFHWPPVGFMARTGNSFVSSGSLD